MGAVGAVVALTVMRVMLFVCEMSTPREYKSARGTAILVWGQGMCCGE